MSKQPIHFIPKRAAAILLAALLTVLCCACLFSCGGQPSEPASSAEPQTSAEASDPGTETSGKPSGVADNTEYYDEITRTLKLSKEYEGKNFLTDGIGEATVSAFTDGDTTRFRLSSGETVIVRYYEVDTPESTSSIEKWGKAASNFTKKCLSSAEQVVLEATGPRAEHDSYGTRYLGYVWYRPAGETAFKCLNLELVENGFTDNKGINTEDYPYYETFNKANQFAKSIQLRLFSSLDDPLFSTDPVPLSLAELEDNPDAYYDPDTDTGARVSLIACLTSLYVSDSGTYTFTATDIDPETGEKHSINIYAGYTSSSASKMKLGHQYKIVGNLQKYGGKFQISGLNYTTTEKYQKDDGKQSLVTKKSYYLTFDSSISYMDQYSQTLYSDFTVKELREDGDYLVAAGEAKLKTRDGYKDETVSYSFRIPKESLPDDGLKEGSVLSFTGWQFTEGSGILDTFSDPPYTLISE